MTTSVAKSPLSHRNDGNGYTEKSVFFDQQADADWASDPYGETEWRKLDILFAEIGDLSGKRILEPGCGTGRLTAVLCQKVGDGGWISALDISPVMTTKARARLKRFENVEVATQSVETYIPPFKGGLDMVLCHQVFPHFEDKTACLRHFNELLKPGGAVVLFHFIDFAEINNVHRKAGSAVALDMMPDDSVMFFMFGKTGYGIRFIHNDENGYFLYADKL